MEFVKYNKNPKNKRTGDCVIRAISEATNNTWENVYMELAKLGIEQGLILNDTANWRKYLEILGYKQEKMPRRKDNTRYTVEEFCVELAELNKTYIVKVANHITLVRNKNLYDTWDCSYKSVGNYWTIGGSKNDN